MAEDGPIGNDEPRRAALLPIAVMSSISRFGARKMTRFRAIDCLFDFLPGLRSLRWLPVLAALAAVAVSGEADAATRRAAGTHNGTWNVVFATTRGNCSSGYSVPFMVMGSRVSSAGGGQVSGTVESRRRGSGQCFGRRIHGNRPWPARRRLRRGRMARHHHRRPLQRHLAGHAKLSAYPSPRNENGPPNVRRAALNSGNSNQRGASTITTWRPSKRASCSTLANSATSAFTLSSSLVPISWCAISRPR